MTGANYTGGKRNVARTRFRDSTRRLQKNHFGRRRLGILSRGLVNGTHATEEVTTSGISSILLEHAQREISRPSRSSPVQRTEARRAFNHDAPSSAGSSTSGSNIVRPHLRFTHTLDHGSCESPWPLSSSWAGRPPKDSSLRAEVNRILEFSRTVGLCNYLTSPRQDVPASLASHVDSELGFDPLQQRNNSFSSMGGSSSGQHAKEIIGYTVQDSEILQMSHTGTSRSNSLREAAPHAEQAHEGETDLVYAELMSNYKYPEHCNSESPAQSCILDSPLGEDKRSPRILESNLYPTDPPSPPFDSLEFSTSLLPPSSPLSSSTTHGSLISLRQVSHRTEAETTLLDFDEIPLPSTMTGSYEVGSSHHGDSRHVTPDSDLASASPLRRLPRSGLAQIFPVLLDSYSKTDLILDLLTCDDPWNVIGDMLDLPPIPLADATYFNSIRSHHTELSHERVSSPTSSSSLGQVGRGEPSCTTRDEGTRLRAVHSDGDLLNCRDLWGVGNSHKTSRRATSLLLSHDSPKKVHSPARSIRSIHETCPSRSAQSPSRSFSATSGKFPVVTEAPQSLLERQAPPTSPGPLRGTSGIDFEESYSPLVKAVSPSPCIVTPQRSSSSSPKNLNSLKESVSRSPGTSLSQRNEITESVPVGLVPNVSQTQITATKARQPKLEFPDLFKDEEDSFWVVF